jgi:hypothetical protein
MSDVNEFNVETGEFVVRPYTDEELIDIERVSSLTSDEPVLLNTSANEALISAMSKLQSLGLTTDEAKAIVGL